MSLRKRLDLKDDESLIAVVRATPVTLFFPALLALALILAPIFFLVPLLRLETLGHIIVGMLFGLGLFFGLRLLVKWWFTMFVVTERRLIITHQDGYLDRHVTELPFGKVHDVAYKIRGFSPTIFRYGTLLIESVGSDRPLEIKKVRRPSVMQSLLTELQTRSEKGRSEFGEMLHAVSSMEAKQLRLLKAEIEQTLERMPDIDERLL